MPLSVKNKPEYSVVNIKKFFRESEHYLDDIYKRNGAFYLKGYREIEADDEIAIKDDMSTSSEDFDIESEETISIR